MKIMSCPKGWLLFEAARPILRKDNEDSKEKRVYHKTGVLYGVKRFLLTDLANVLASLLPSLSSCDDSFGRLQWSRLHILACNQMRVANCAIVFSQMNHHVI